MHPRTTILAVALLALTGAFAAAQTSYPMITHATPVAIQRGAATEVTVEGQMNFAGAYKVLFDDPALSAEVLPATGPTAAAPAPVRLIKLKLTATPAARLGIHEFRVATNLGISSVGQLLVTGDRVLAEVGDNNTTAKATALTMPCVACGRIEALEDVDYYKLRGEAGQRLTFEVFGARIQDKIHDLQKHADPILSLHDADGRELAANDDFSFADPLLTFTLPKAGDYFLQVRDSKYDGDPRWAYAVAVTADPYVSQVFPMASNPGRTIDVEPVGSAKLWSARVPLKVPTEPGLGAVQLTVDGTATNPTAFVVSELPQVFEREPNDDPKLATRLTVPCGVNGRVGVRRDLDHFTFAATKGKAVRLEVKARRFGTPLRSSLDSILDVLNASGAVVATNDDANGKDAALVFTPPADGDYVVRLRDLNSKGGDTFVYYLEVDWARPDFTLRCDPDKAMIGPGSSAAWYVHVNRLNGFDGPVQVELQGLPRGVTASPLTIPPTMTQGLVVLSCDANAPRDAANVRLVGSAMVKTLEGKEERRTLAATPNEEIYMPGGGRGRFDVGLQSVAVTEPSDIHRVEVSPKEVSLRPGEEVRLEVTVHRGPKYDKPVSLDVALQHLGSVFGNPLPPGVTVVENKSKTLLGTGNKGHITLRAAPDAKAIDGVPISVLCHVSINFVVKVSYSSAPIPVTVQAK